MAPGVPLKVMAVVVPEQIVVVPEILAVGNALTVTIAFPDKFWVQGDAPDDVTLTNA